MINMLYQKILANLIIALLMKPVTRDFWVHLEQKLENANAETGHHVLKTNLRQLVMRKTVNASVAQLEFHLKVVYPIMKFVQMENAHQVSNYKRIRNNMNY